ncbi:MAG: hypothetical protein KF778_11535 [Rhodocyclaceae bacterium]|nr:hypothetical protein [Rhodocyclaceae bacterium]MBX3669027.1 hypothetical protein [Rhodocyclaceae bacterium]
MSGQLVSPSVAVAMIKTGRYFSVAGDESLLATLPKGNWIGGSITYFMGQDGGETTRDRLFVTPLPTFGLQPELRMYDLASLPQVCEDAPAHGYSVIIIPAFTDVHVAFARNAPNYPDMYMKPLIGWIAGLHLDDVGMRDPVVVDGREVRLSDREVAVLHVPLPQERNARIDIVNLFVPGDGPAIVFPQGGFSAGACRVGGEAVNLADYITRQKIDTRLPLVADYCGAKINVSVRAVDAARQRVDFYAPVFEDMEYRFAAPIADYVQAFQRALPDGVERESFSCNCILNYLYSELEGKKTGNMTGPMTFGEVAYQLMNQTMVYLTISD